MRRIGVVELHRRVEILREETGLELEFVHYPHTPHRISIGDMPVTGYGTSTQVYDQLVLWVKGYRYALANLDTAPQQLPESICDDGSIAVEGEPPVVMLRTDYPSRGSVFSFTRITRLEMHGSSTNVYGDGHKGGPSLRGNPHETDVCYPTRLSRRDVSGLAREVWGDEWTCRGATEQQEPDGRDSNAREEWNDDD